MAIFGKNGFIRKQEAGFARRLLIWKYDQSGTALPNEKALSAQAQQIVDDAHAIAKKSSSNVLELIKEAVKDLKKFKR
ncbi:MAG: hypothetical protein GY729_13735 [Desulfobacteraceae bacterium]|nr:hypothetical protein [Desulfobacteraceae bacterium]